MTSERLGFPILQIARIWNERRKNAFTTIILMEVSFAIQFLLLRIISNWFQIEKFAGQCMKLEIPGFPNLQIART